MTSIPKLIHVNQIDKDSIEHAFDLNKRTEKIITFIYPSITEGRIGSFYKFPFNGIVKRIDAYCVQPSIVDTVFSVEKVSEEDFKKDVLITPTIHNFPVTTNIENNKHTVNTTTMQIDFSITHWQNILSTNVTIPKTQNFQDNTYKIKNDTVNENDLFRINFISCTPEDKSLIAQMAYNLTIQIVIQTNDNY
jgi:hypothetical protein